MRAIRKPEFFVPVLLMLAAAAIVPRITSSTAWNLVAVVVVGGVGIALGRVIRRSH